MSLKSVRISLVISLVFSSFIAFRTFTIIQAQTSPCATNTANLGQVSGSFNIPVAGTYRVWSRMQPDSTTSGNNSYTIEVDDTHCNITVGDSIIPVNTWTWVDYQSGNNSSKINLTLSAGTHTFKIFGREAGVRVDKIVFSGNPSCVPTDTGNNCATGPSTPTTLAGDVNSDSVVNIFDLSILLSNWNGVGRSRAQGDLDGNSTVNIFDLSILLSNWGRTG